MKITVVTNNIPSIKENIEKLIKRAHKLNVDPPIVSYSEPTIVKAQNKFLSLTDIEIINPIIKLNEEWKLVATIERFEAGNLINAVPHLSDRLPTNLRTEHLTTCDHCKTNRKRNKYIAITNDNHELKLVGSTCIKDFLGHNAERMIKYFANIQTFCQSIDSYEEGDSNSKYLLEHIGFIMSQTIAVLDLIPWVSSKGATEDNLPTYAHVVEQIFDYKKIKASDRIVPTSKHHDLADQILQRWASMSESINANTCSNIDWKKHLLYSEKYIGIKQFPLCVGLIYGETIAIQREIEKLKKSNIFFGKEGQRDYFMIKISQVKTLENDWGIIHLVKGIDIHSQGEFTWFDSTCKNWYEVGLNYAVKATIKRHNENDKYGNQTILSRVALLHDM